MILHSFCYIYFLITLCFPLAGCTQDVTLDLKQNLADDKVEVLHSVHYDLRSKEFYLKEGYRAVKVVDGQSRVWEKVRSEYTRKAVLFMENQPLSLLYLDVFDQNSEFYKYFVKVGGVWREVLEHTFDIFLDIDRSQYTQPQLEKFALELLDNLPKYTGRVVLYVPMTFSFIVEPQYPCQLNILRPDTAAIMEQKIIGPVFSLAYTPRTDFAINSVFYGDQLLWEAGADMLICSSVWVSFRSTFEDLVLLNFQKAFTDKRVHQCFAVKLNTLVPITYEEYVRSLMKMLLKEYDERDIACYKDGYLKKKDIAQTLKSLIAILLIATTVCYTQF